MRLIRQIFIFMMLSGCSSVAPRQQSLFAIDEHVFYKNNTIIFLCFWQVNTKYDGFSQEEKISLFSSRERILGEFEYLKMLSIVGTDNSIVEFKSGFSRIKYWLAVMIDILDDHSMDFNDHTKKNYMQFMPDVVMKIVELEASFDSKSFNMQDTIKELEILYKKASPLISDVM